MSSVKKRRRSSLAPFKVKLTDSPGYTKDLNDQQESTDTAKGKRDSLVTMPLTSAEVNYVRKVVGGFGKKVVLLPNPDNLAMDETIQMLEGRIERLKTEENNWNEYLKELDEKLTIAESLITEYHTFLLLEFSFFYDNETIRCDYLHGNEMVGRLSELSQGYLSKLMEFADNISYVASFVGFVSEKIENNLEQDKTVLFENDVIMKDEIAAEYLYPMTDLEDLAKQVTDAMKKSLLLAAEHEKTLHKVEQKSSEQAASYEKLFKSLHIEKEQDLSSPRRTIQNILDLPSVDDFTLT